MDELLMRTLIARLDFAARLVSDPPRSRRVGEILSKPCFSALARVSAHRDDRWVDHAPTSAETIATILCNQLNSAVSLDTQRGKELVASGEIKNGIRETNEGATRFYGYLAIPLPQDPELVVTALCELANAVDAGAGFIAVEPDYNHGQNAALGGAIPKLRPGLGPERARARRARDWHQWKRQEQLAGVEWGTFLGAQHLAKLDLGAIRASGGFERVVQVSPTLVFLQVTKDPADDLRDDFAAKLQRAREALLPIMMDISDVKVGA